MTKSSVAGLFAGLIGLSVLIAINANFARQSPGGSDFVPRWVGARDYFLKGWSPYSAETTQDIHAVFYGRAALPGEDQVLYVYPLYSLIVFAPFALFSDYVLARAVWMTVLELALVALAVVSVRLTQWRMSGWLLISYIVFAALWYHGVRPVINGNAVVVCGLFIALGLALVRAEKDLSAAALFALASIKPQVVALFIPCVLWWAITHRRWRLVVGLGAAFLSLMLGAMLLQPDWLVQNIRQILSYPTYTEPGTPAEAFARWWPQAGPWLGGALTIGLGVLLAREGWLARRSGFPGLLWLSSLTLVVTQLIGIRTDPTNFIMLFLPVALVGSELSRQWGDRVVAGLLLVLLIGLWLLFIATIARGAQPVQNPVMFFPLPGLLIAGLYLVRRRFINDDHQ
ncbi:MAG: DUF2029 domain-containing protein [Thermoflexales bacterium]|nr:DUF2029 domain-containing protein [Thermoflexales bacterium]